MARRRRLTRWIPGICAVLALLLSGWVVLSVGFAHAEPTLGPPADASCASLARVDWTATNGPQWGRTLLSGHGAPGGWFGVDVCGNGINAYAPGGANLSCDRVPANFRATGCAPGGATYDGFGLTFQCVELVVRFSAWAFGDRPSAWLGNAPDLWLSGNHPADFTAIRNGTSQPPVPGDVLVWGAVDASGRPWPAGPNGDHDGHNAVVAAVHGGQVLIVEENALWGATNVPSETLPLAHNGANWYLGKSNTLYGWLHSSKNTGRFDGHGAVRGTPNSPPNRSANSSTGLPSLAQGVVVTSAGTLADLTWFPAGAADATANADTVQSAAVTAPHAAARDLGAPPSARLAPAQTPAALVSPTGGRDVYAIGQDGQLYAAHTTPTQLGVAWQALGAPPGVTLVGSVAASPLPGGIAVGAIGSDGSLWWRGGPAGNLGGWTALGHPAQTTLAGALALAGTPGSGLPLALALGRDGHLYESDWINPAPEGGASGSGAALPPGWDGWAPVALPAQAGLLVDSILPIFELPPAHDRIGTWADAPLDVVTLDANGALWLLRRSGASTAWQPYPIAGAAGVEAVLGGVAVPAPAPDGSASPTTTLLHVYTSSMRGTALVSLRLDQSGHLAPPTWTQVAPPLAIADLGAQGSAVGLGPDLSLLVVPSGQRVALAGTAPALALVSPPPATANASAATPAAPSWTFAGTVAGPDSFADLFQTPALDPRWLLVGAPDAARVASGGGVALEPPAAPGRTMLLQGAPAGDLQVTVQVAFPASAPAATQAGALLYLDDGDWLTLGVSRSGAASFCPVAWEHTFPCQSATLPRAGAPGQGVYLRFERYGSIFTGLVSADGVGWSLVGSWRPVWPGAPVAGTATPASTPSPTTTGVGRAPAPAASQDVAPLAFTSVGVYAQNPSGGALPASASSAASTASGWPTFLSFDVAAPGAASGATP